MTQHSRVEGSLALTRGVSQHPLFAHLADEQVPTKAGLTNTLGLIKAITDGHDMFQGLQALQTACLNVTTHSAVANVIGTGVRAPWRSKHTHSVLSFVVPRCDRDLKGIGTRAQ